MGPGRSEFAKHAVMTVIALGENHACTQRKVTLVNTKMTSRAVLFRSQTLDFLTNIPRKY